MKHAFLILRQDETVQQVANLIDLLNTIFAECQIYVAQNNLSNLPFAEAITGSAANVKWWCTPYKEGSYTELKVVQNMLFEAYYNNSDVDYFHLIRANYLPLINSQQVFDNVLGGNSYITYGAFPVWTPDGYEQAYRYHFSDSEFKYKKANRRLLNLQKTFDINNGLKKFCERNNITLGYNSHQWSLSHRVVEAILNFDKDLTLMHKLAHCSNPREMYIGTILNSIQDEVKNISQNFKRFKEIYVETEGMESVSISPRVMTEYFSLKLNKKKDLFAGPFNLKDMDSACVYKTLKKHLLKAFQEG